MTEFFPVLDAIEVNRVSLRCFVKYAEFDLLDIFIANEETYCINCGRTIEKYTPLQALFTRGKLIRILCVFCVNKRKGR